MLETQIFEPGSAVYKADDLSMSSHATESHNSLQYLMLPNETIDFDF